MSSESAPPTITPLEAWFSRFDGFKITRAPPYQQYNKLCKQHNWDEQTERVHHRSFLRAFRKQYSSPVDLFFVAYAASDRFPYDPSATPASRWRKLKSKMGWNDRKSKPYKKARDRFRMAVGEEVEGDAAPEQKRKRWTTMCEVLRVEPIPKTAKLCKEARALKPFMVNIYDMLASIRTRESSGRIERPKTWKTVPELSDYCYDNDLVYPLCLAKGEIVGFLLRKISIGRGQHHRNGDAVMLHGRRE